MSGKNEELESMLDSFISNNDEQAQTHFHTAFREKMKAHIHGSDDETEETDD